MTDLEFGRLSYGAAAAGNLYRAIDDEQAAATLDAAWECGVRYFDTAPHYGLGLSERRLGRMLQMRPRDEFCVSTKVGRLLKPNPDGADQMDNLHFVVPATSKRVWDMSESGIRRSHEESLERLGLDHVDILYLHDIEAYDADDAIARGLPALCKLRDEGLVSAIGVGSGSVDAQLKAVRTGAVDLIMLAGRYTLLEQPALNDLLPECEERGIRVVNAAIFNSGLLATPVPRSDSHYEYLVAPPEILQHAHDLLRVCTEFGVELPAAALQYTLRHPAVATVVIGAHNPEQIRQNADRMSVDIPDGLWTRLAEDGLIPA